MRFGGVLALLSHALAQDDAFDMIPEPTPAPAPAPTPAPFIKKCKFTGQKQDRIHMLPDAAQCTILQFSGGGLTALKKGDLDAYLNIEQLLLVRNKISSIEPGVFDQNKKLTWIDLMNNELANVPSGVFNTMPALKQTYADETKMPFVILTRNKIATIADGAFAGVHRVRLGGNKELSTLRTSWFSGE
jgi:hypothetical protein